MPREKYEVTHKELSTIPSNSAVPSYNAVVEDTREEEEEENARGNWGLHIEFILSVIGYAVGLGNVWRFPFQCYKHGGGAFLLVYWFLSLCVGFPIIFFEQSLGQYTSQGPTHAYGFSPIIRGIGYSMFAISTLACIYYNVIIAWSIFMMFASFTSTLPWATCDFSNWANYRCELPKVACNETQDVRSVEGLCYNSTFLPSVANHYGFTQCPNGSSIEYPDDVCLNFTNAGVAKSFRNITTVIGFWNETLSNNASVGAQLSTEQYFYHHVLRLYDGYDTENIGTPSWGLALSLLLAWVIVFLCLINGVKTAGKVVYFTALFPYVIIFILIGKGASLPGAYDGIMFYLTPKFEKLQDPAVWFAAANQLFFSLSAGWGGMIALSSYNKFNNTVLRDAIITVIADSLTSFTAGFAIFSIIGYGAHSLGQPVDEVAKAGTGLAFVMYPKVILAMPASTFWAIAFFFMLLLLGLDSEFNAMETVLTILLDHLPYFRKNLKRKTLFLGCLCVLFYILALPIICNGGSYLIDIVDVYSSGWGALIVGIIELLSISWIYGSHIYHKDIQVMMGIRIWGDIGKFYIGIFWRVISPGLVLFILIYSWVSYKSIAHNRTEEAIGWCCTAFVLIWPIFFAIFETARASGDTFLDKLLTAASPSREWGPYLVRDRRKVTHLGPDFKIDPRGVLKKRKHRRNTRETSINANRNPAFSPDRF